MLHHPHRNHRTDELIRVYSMSDDALVVLLVARLEQVNSKLSDELNDNDAHFAEWENKVSELEWEISEQEEVISEQEEVISEQEEEISALKQALKALNQQLETA